MPPIRSLAHPRLVAAIELICAYYLPLLPCLLWRVSASSVTINARVIR
jgi:hypothetical protein